METRRAFLVQAPLGLATALAACGDGAPNGTVAAVAAGSERTATSSTVAPPPLLASIPPGAPELRWTPKHDELTYTFGGAAPRHHIASGTHIITWCEDAFDGLLKSPADRASKLVAPDHFNALTGPFHVDGAEPGDTLAVHVVRLEPARSYGISITSPGFGALTGSESTAMLGPELPETTWRYEVDAARKMVRTMSRDGARSWEVPLSPFLGCLGVAPAVGEVRSSVVPGVFGGNMDCPQVRAGNTVFLGVNVRGGLLSFGDGHYAMGDGEIIGTAVEGAMHVEVVVELLKGKATPLPRIENAHEVMFVGVARPLEDAARMAFKAMVRWVIAASGVGELDAYQFVAQGATASIVQMVDPEYTVLVRLDKRRLPTARR